MPFYFDSYYLILILPALLLTLWAQSKVNGTYNRYKNVKSSRGLTGAEAARRILDDNGLRDVRVERIRGNLTDNYDPRSRVVHLSEGVYAGNSIAAIGIAAHECGHAVQHATAYAPLTLRNAVIPVTNIGANLSMPLLLAGIIFSSQSLIMIGILGFALVTVFQLITLPVEYNASSRAIATLQSHQILYDDELLGAKKVLSAAALTYLAALILSVAQLLRLWLLFGGRGRRRS